MVTVLGRSLQGILALCREISTSKPPFGLELHGMGLAEPQLPELFFSFILFCLEFCNFLKLLGFTVSPLIRTQLLPIVQPTLLPCTLLYTSMGGGGITPESDSSGGRSHG